MTDNIKEDSLKTRYLYKLSANLAGLGIGVFTQALIPRGLGPKLYGDYNFLMNFFTQVVNFFDMGSSMAFYTKLSQRPREFKLASFYIYFIGIIALIMVSFVVLTQTAGLSNIFWPDQAVRFIYFSAFLGILIWLTNIMTRMADAYALTVSTEMAKISQKVLGLIILAVLLIYNRLSLETFFFYNYFILLLLGWAFYLIFKKHGYCIMQDWKMTFSEVKKYAAEFYAYSHPLFLYGLVGMIAGIFDRWLLQVYAGSVEQGFFGLSYQIGAICFMFTSAMTPLIMREFSIAYNNKDLKLMAQLFRKHVPLLYSITALLACFIAVNAGEATVLMGGGHFRAASLVVAIMAFFPIHQVYGQLSGSVFYASGRTKLYCNIGIIFMVLSLPLTYFLIAPRSSFGLGAGAAGLASKTLLIQFLAVNTQLYFNSRLLGFAFWKYLVHQLASIGAFLMLAVLSKLIINSILSMRGGIVINFVSSGILYLAISSVLVYFIPSLIGWKKKEA